MSKPKREILVNKNQEVVGIRVTKFQEQPFVVPVLDVRRSKEERLVVDRFIRNANAAKGSKFIISSFALTGFSYNVSRKQL